MPLDPALNSLGFPKAARRHARCRGDVGRRRFSSVVAAMLAEEGYDVVGVTLQLYDHGAALAKKGACCAGIDIHDARRVAEEMGFPHYVLDYENIFRDAVIDEFADSYLAGATPVPCIRCNERVKFKDLLETARDLDADCMATGHYIQRKMGTQGPGVALCGGCQPRSVLFPVLHHPGTAGLPAVPAGPPAVEGGHARIGGQIRPACGRQARQPGHLLCAQRKLCGGDRKTAPRCRRTR